MDVNPVKETEKPKYPLKTEISEVSLKKALPGRWTRSTAAKVALGTLAAMTLTACGPTNTTPEGSPKPTAVITEISASQIVEATPFGEAMTPYIMVAPLFLHGEGRGSFGCDMVTPPAFISEQEAMDIINEIAKEYGLEFTSEDTPEFYNVLQPGTDPNPKSIENSEITKAPDKVITLKADFADTEHGVVLAFVSADDTKGWRQWPVTTSVEVFDIKDAADQLNDSLETATRQDYRFYTMGVLYDPCEFSENETEARVMSQEQLKAQAKDFFEWLKSQGVI